MASIIQNMLRIFIYRKNGTEMELTDFNPSFDPKDILSFYANTYPELTTASVTGPEIKHDKVYYYFKETLGLKG